MSLDAVGIVSENIQLSLKFYELLGVHLQEKGGPDHWEGSTPSGVRLMLDSLDLIKRISPDWKEPVGSGVILCFKQDSSEQVDELFLTVIEAGFKPIKAPWDAFWGQRYASVQDPDGNQIDIFAPL